MFHSKDRLIIFDIDGTLADSQKHILDAMAHAFSALGLAPPPRRAITDTIGLSLPQAMARLAPDATHGAHSKLVNAYIDASRAMIAASDAPPALFPGAVETIKRLAGKGWMLSVATGKSRRGLERLLSAYDLGHYFYATQTADDAPSKPHPTMIRNCLSAHGLDPCQAVMIGDTEYDMAMAHNAGTHGIGVNWGHHSPDRLFAAGAFTVIEHFDAIDTMMANLPASI